MIAVPVAVKSLDEELLKNKSQMEEEKQQQVLDEFGDLTPYLANGSLKDGSGFRIILERYDAGSIRDHVARLRTLLEGNAPSATTLVDGTGSDDDDDVTNQAMKMTTQETTTAKTRKLNPIIKILRNNRRMEKSKSKNCLSLMVPTHYHQIREI